jgi:hypothetical protein
MPSECYIGELMAKCLSHKNVSERYETLKKTPKCIGFDVLTAVKSILVFWVVMPCGLGNKTDSTKHPDYVLNKK